MERLLAERQFHDEQAGQRRLEFERDPARLRFSSKDWLDHETWIRPALAQFGDLSDKTILDYGCGHGMAAVTFARMGARVNALDLSEGYVEETRRRAEVNEVWLEAEAGDCEHLPYEDESFDAIWGNAILHHLDLTQAAKELRRVLKPDGIAVMCEPWGGNPLLRFARATLPYRGKHRTDDERPLLYRDLEPLRSVFPNLHWQGYQLLGMTRRVIGNTWLTRMMDRIDNTMIHRLKFMNHWCRYVVITMTKD